MYKRRNTVPNTIIFWNVITRALESWSQEAAKKQSRTKWSNAKAKMVPIVSNMPSDSDSQRSGEDEDGVQSHEISNNECAVCFGLYQDDLSSTGKLLTEWVECTNAGCKKWMHAQCLQLSDEKNCIYLWTL